ncbi:hypothetical protein [Levilactobacillus cerevisiae]|uniref:hypothetical protein n=1 Tax=Levilactobacillus cerevisiae TaxID=1704076 RepID=UPI000F792041|nr:hypothetical protein [Levilactobacillus cerevisiae]
MTVKIYQYESSEPVAPGGSLKEFMNVQGISATQLAEQGNVSPEYVPADFWLRYDAKYHQALTAAQKREE